MAGLGFYPGDIYFPLVEEMEKWSVVACDQYTAQPDYWQRVEKRVGDAPSALRMIVPECYLGTPQEEEMCIRDRSGGGRGNSRVPGACFSAEQAGHLWPSRKNL